MLGSIVLAGLGCAALMRNPRRKKRRASRRNPRSGARDPHEYEMGSYLFKEFKGLKKQGVFGTPEGASHLCRIFNAATAPNLFRTDEDSRTSGRVAMLCRRIRTNHYGSRSIQETADGAWYPVRRNPRKGAKTKLVYVIQGNYGYGWDDENEEDNRVDAKRSIKEYRDNGPGSYRLIRRRVPIEAAQPNPRSHSGRKITKKQFYSLGAWSNSKLYRVQKGGRWHYYQTNPRRRGKRKTRR